MTNTYHCILCQKEIISELHVDPQKVVCSNCASGSYRAVWISKEEAKKRFPDKKDVIE